MENQKKPSGLKIFFFGFAKIFAIGSSIIGLFVIAILLKNLLDPNKTTHIALADINTSKTTNIIEEASSKPVRKLITAENIKKHMSGKNQKILQGWVNKIDGDDKKQEFLTNMSEVITAAEIRELELVNVINNYKTLKIFKLNKSKLDAYKELVKQAILCSIIFAIVIFIALMSLLLIMLAIERNTRNRTAILRMQKKDMASLISLE